MPTKGGNLAASCGHEGKLGNQGFCGERALYKSTHGPQSPR